MSGIPNQFSRPRKRRPAAAAAASLPPSQPSTSTSGSATPRSESEFADAVALQMLQRALPPPPLPERLWKWLEVEPGRAMRELRAAVDAEMPGALPEERDTIARRRMRDIERDKKAAFQCYVPDNRVCALLLDAYQAHGDVEARTLYRDVRRYLIESECRGEDARVERERRLAELDRLLETLLAPGARTPATQLVAAAQSPAGAVRSAAEFVRLFTQPADLTQSDSELMQSHCESTMRALLDTVNLTARLVQSAPADTVFGDAAVHPVDKLLLLLRESGHTAIREQTIIDYLALWQRAPELSQQDVDRQLFAYHKRDEMRVLERRLRELQLSEADTNLVLAYGVETQQSPLLRAVVQVLENDRFIDAERSAAKRFRFAELVDGQRRESQRTAVDDDGDAGDAAAAADPLTRLLPIYQQAARELPTYPRALLQQFLREPLPPSVASTERACFNRELCIAMTSNVAYPLLSIGSGGGGGSKQQGFICRAFEPNITREQIERQSPALCLLCNRYATTHQVLTLMRSRPGHTAPLPLTLLQDHAVAIGDGEYNADVMLPLTLENAHFNGIVKPQIMFSAAHYAPATTVVAGHTLRCVLELKALDFRPRWAGAVAAT